MKRVVVFALALAACGHLRPVDRAGAVTMTGAATMLGGAFLVGIDGRCTGTLSDSLETPVCPTLYDTASMGGVMVYVGAPVAVAGAIWMVWLALTGRENAR